MWTFSKKLIKEATELGQEMLRSGEIIRSLTFGKGNILFVTSDPKKVLVSKCVVVEGVPFYIGSLEEYWRSRS